MRQEEEAGSAESRRVVLLLNALLAMTALATCLVFRSWTPLPRVADDAVEYLDLARNVANGDGFSTDGGATPAVYRAPIFSTLLGGWYRLTGVWSVGSAAMLQSILHAAGVSAAFALYLEITPSLLAAFAAALFVALNPVLFTRVVFVLQEPAVIFFTILAAWISVRLIRRPSDGRAAAAGIAWGLSTLTKVVTWYAPVLLAVMQSLPRRMRPSFLRRQTVLVLVFTAATIAPWTIRNWLQFHRFIPVQGQGAGMLEWNVRQATPRGEPSGAAFVAALDEEGVTGAARARALTRYILERPRHFFIDRVLRNTIHFAGLPRDWWLARGLVSLEERGPVYWTLVAIFHLPLYVFLVLRTGQWLRGRLAPEWGFVILLYWTYWAEHAVIWGDPRFGLGVYPLLVGMALPPRQVTMPRSS